MAIDGDDWLKCKEELGVFRYNRGKISQYTTINPFVLDLIDVPYNSKARKFRMQLEDASTPTYLKVVSEITGWAAEDEDLAYSIYDDAGDYLGLYKLTGEATDIEFTKIVGVDIGVLAYRNKYVVAEAATSYPISNLSEGIKAFSTLKSITSRGIDNILSISEDRSSVPNVVKVSITLLSNEYTYDLKQFRVCAIPGTATKRLNFPFCSSFSVNEVQKATTPNAEWVDIGSPQPMTADNGLYFDTSDNPMFILIFFKDGYGNVSLPIIYVLNP